MLKIRKATRDDADAMAGTILECWRKNYRGVVPDSHLEAMTLAERKDELLSELDDMRMHGDRVFLVADLDGSVIGLVGGGKRREGPREYDGELYGVYIQPARQHRGLGTALVREFAKWVSAEGYKRMMLWTFADSEPARHFYEELGGRLLATDRTIKLSGKELTLVAYGWEDLDALVARLRTREVGDLTISEPEEELAEQEVAESVQEEAELEIEREEELAEEAQEAAEVEIEPTEEEPAEIEAEEEEEPVKAAVEPEEEEAAEPVVLSCPREEIDLFENAGEILRRMAHGGVFCTVADSEGLDNVLTIGWGQLGRGYEGDPIFIIAITPLRHSFRFIEETGEFVIAVGDDSLRFAAELCGSKSGRDMDKFKAAGLTRVESAHVKPPSIAECPINIECRVYAKIPPPHELLTPDHRKRPLSEQHTIYFARVLGAYRYEKE